MLIALGGPLWRADAGPTTYLAATGIDGLLQAIVAGCGWYVWIRLVGFVCSGLIVSSFLLGLLLL